MNKQKKSIFLFDYTGVMAEPWADAGYLCYCFDGQHEPGVSTTSHKNILNVGMWFCKNYAASLGFCKYPSRSDIDKIKVIVGDNVKFVFGFPECTDLTNAGAKHFKKKRIANPSFQLDAMSLVYLVKLVGDEFKCHYGFENPIGAITKLWRKWDFRFNPCDYSGYLSQDEEHPLYPNIYPVQDRYNKNTCIWHGGGVHRA